MRTSLSVIKGERHFTHSPIRVEPVENACELINPPHWKYSYNEDVALFGRLREIMGLGSDDDDMRTAAPAPFPSHGSVMFIPRFIFHRSFMKSRLDRWIADLSMRLGSDHGNGFHLSVFFPSSSTSSPSPPPFPSSSCLRIIVAFPSESVGATTTTTSSLGWCFRGSDRSHPSMVLLLDDEYDGEDRVWSLRNWSATNEAAAAKMTSLVKSPRDIPSGRPKKALCGAGRGTPLFGGKG